MISVALQSLVHGEDTSEVRGVNQCMSRQETNGRFLGSIRSCYDSDSAIVKACVK